MGLVYLMTWMDMMREALINDKEYKRRQVPVLIALRAFMKGKISIWIVIWLILSHLRGIEDLAIKK